MVGKAMVKGLGSGGKAMVEGLGSWWRSRGRGDRVMVGNPRWRVWRQ